jgi:hypothetical protein
MTTKHVHKSLSSLAKKKKKKISVFVHSEIQVLGRKYFENWKSYKDLWQVLVPFRLISTASGVTYHVLPFFLLHVKAFSLQFTHEFKERRNGMLHNFAKSTLKLHRKKRKVNKNTNTEPNKKTANSFFILTQHQIDTEPNKKTPNSLFSSHTT